MSNILTIVKGNYNASLGGPTGYVSKLKLALDDNADIDFLFLDTENKKKGNSNLFVNYIKKLIPGFIEKFRANRIFKRKILNFINPEFSFSEKNRIRNSFKKKEYSAIHCHRVEELIMTHNLLEEENIRLPIILTLHNPTKPSIEQFSAWEKSFGKENAKEWQKRMEIIENKAIELAEGFIFPCFEAIENYFKIWNKFEEAFNEKPVSYCLTGTQPQTFKTSKEEFFQKYNIKNDAFVLSFVGRHNEVKGYDLFKEAGKQLLNEYKDLYILVAGAEFPLEGIMHDRWIEIGWTTDPGSVINASDLFILPNRVTYFDLVLLEAMSLKKAVLASNTGGNKKVASMSAGVELFDPEVKSLTVSLKELLRFKEGQIQTLGEENFQCYKEYFSLESFASAYKKALSVHIN